MDAILYGEIKQCVESLERECFASRGMFNGIFEGDGARLWLP